MSASVSFRSAKLLACSFRVFILRALSAATRKVLHVFRDLTLPRSCLRSTLAQIGDLLLPSGRSRLSTALTARATHLLQTLLRLLQTFERPFVLRDRLA